MQPDTSSLERLVPDALAPEDGTGTETLDLHVERYAFAARHTRPGRLLDIACGVGYGTRHVADQAAGVDQAVGVDFSPEAIRYARGRYERPGIEYVVGDAMVFADPRGFDTVISLETIEHVPDPEGLVRRLGQLLRPGGVLIASVPTTPSVDVNPHHLHDFSEGSFRRMLEPLGFQELDALAQTQGFQPLSVLRRREQRLADMRRNLVGYYLQHPGAALRRAGATLRYGFTNRYLTLALQRP